MATVTGPIKPLVQTGEKENLQYGTLPEGTPGESMGLTPFEQAIETGKRALESGPIGIPGYAPGYLQRYLDEYNIAKEAKFANEPLLSVDELKTKYSDTPDSFKESLKEPMSARVAEFRYNNFRRQDDREKALDYAATKLGMVGTLAASSVALFDPANLALNFATGGSATIYEVAAINAASLAATEIPGHYFRKREGLAPKIEETAATVAGGTLLGVAAHYVLPAVWGYSKNISTRVRRKYEEMGVRQSDRGEVIDTRAARTSDKAARNGAVGESVPVDKATGSPLAPELPPRSPDATARTWWVAVGDDGSALPIHDTDLGRAGIEGIGDRVAAGNVAGETVQQVTLSPDAVVKHDSELVGVSSPLGDAAKKAGLEVTDKTTYRGLLRQIADNLQLQANSEEAEQAVIKLFQDGKIDAVVSSVEGSPADSIRIFNESSIADSATHEVDQVARVGMESDAPSRSIYDDPEIDAELDKVTKGSYENDIIAEAEEQAAHINKELDEAVAEGLITEEEVLAIKAGEKEARLVKSGGDLIIKCLSGGRV